MVLVYKLNILVSLYYFSIPMNFSFLISYACLILSRNCYLLNNSLLAIIAFSNFTTLFYFEGSANQRSQFYLVKWKQTLQISCYHGTFLTFNFLREKTFVDHWHAYLGHPHSRTIDQIISCFNLPYLDSKFENKCISFLLEKMFRLLYFVASYNPLKFSFRKKNAFLLVTTLFITVIDVWIKILATYAL